MSQLFEVRPGTDADVVPLCEFLNACTLVHQGVSRSSPADIVTRLHLESADPRLDSFVVARKTLETSGYPAPLYNLACCEALAGRSEDAIGHLRLAFERRPSLRDLAQTDTDLDALRDEPAFRELVG